MACYYAALTQNVLPLENGFDSALVSAPSNNMYPQRHLLHLAQRQDFLTTFLLSTVCEMPFAKRNFVKRHGHGIVQSSKELQESDVDELCCPVIPSSSPSITLDNQEVARRLKRVVSFDLTQQRRRKLVEAKDMTMMNGNEHLWLELLRERPDTEDQKKMNSWMDKVISYSEEMRGKSHKPATQEASLLFGKQFTQTEPTPIAPRRTTTPSHEPTGTFNAVSPTTRNADYTDMVCGALRESINEEEVEFAASMGDFDFSALFEDNDPKKEV